MVPIKERRLLWKWLFALAALQHAELLIRKVQYDGIDEKHPLYAPMISGAQVHYSRAFTSSDGATMLPPSAVPSTHKVLHSSVMVIRHKMVAHSDAKSTFSNIGVPLNAAVLKVRASGSSFANSNYPFKASKLPEFLALIELVSVEGKVFVQRFREDYGEEFPKEFGDYRLNLSDENEPLWVRYEGPPSKV